MESSAAAAVRTRTATHHALSDGWILGGLVALSAFIRFCLSALPLQTPFYLPDEYTYTALARGIAETGHPVIRTAPAHFPALLEPLLAAPFWLLGNAELAFRLTQAEHALAISLGAVPAYLIGRRVGLTSRFSLGIALLVLASPNIVLGSLVVAEPIAFPLVLTAVYAAIVALETHSRRAQLAVVALVGLAVFSRVQYVLLVPVLIAAALVVERGSFRRSRHSFGLATLAFAVLGVLAIASGPHRVLGTYDSVFHLHASIGTFADQLAVHALLVPFAAGIVLVPGALVGLARGVLRPASRAESAFAAITVLLALGVTAQAVLIAATISGNFGERYLFVFFPLLAVAFGLYARRGGARAWVCGLAALLVVLAMRFPLSHYTPHSSDSTLLWAVGRLETWTGTTEGALIAGIGAILLAVLAVWAGWLPQRRATVALAVAIVAQFAVAVAATSSAVAVSQLARSALPADARWVDHARVGDVTLVGLPGNNAGAGVEEVLWNSSIVNVVRLPGAKRFDPGKVSEAHVSADGSLVTPDGAVNGAVLVDRVGTWMSLSGAHLVRTTVGTNAAAFDLWAPTAGRARVVAEAVGLHGDNWLARSGSITVWPAKVRRRLSLRVKLPDPRAATDTIHFTGAATASLVVQPTQARTITFLIPAGTHPWTVRWFCDRFGYRNGTPVSFLSAPPRITVASGPLR